MGLCMVIFECQSSPRPYIKIYPAINNNHLVKPSSILNYQCASIPQITPNSTLRQLRTRCFYHISIHHSPELRDSCVVNRSYPLAHVFESQYTLRNESEDHFCHCITAARYKKRDSPSHVYYMQVSLQRPRTYVRERENGTVQCFFGTMN